MSKAGRGKVTMRISPNTQLLFSVFHRNTESWKGLCWRIGESWACSTWSRHRRDPTADSNQLMGGHREHGTRFFKEVHDGGMRNSGSKLEGGNSS